MTKKGLESTVPKRRSQRWKAFRTFQRNKIAVVGAVLSLGVLVLAVFAPQIAPRDPLSQNLFYRLTAPERDFLFGTDFMGRDVFSRVIVGARMSLLVGLSAVAVGMTFGTMLGMLAAYVRGRVESLLMRVIDVWMSFPDEVLGILAAVMIGTGVGNLIAILGLLLVPRFSRLSYNYTTVMREGEFVSAARAIGVSGTRIVLRHIFPNIRGDVVTMGALWLGTAIRLEANLSFLGVGVPPPTPTWGNMIREGMARIVEAPWISLFPGVALVITVLAFNLLADGLRDISDPRLRS